MKIEVLLSCMNQEDFSIINRSNLQKVNTVVVNQCDTDREEVLTEGIHRMVKTPTRGLSVSRNIAIEHATADVCLLADDDERFDLNLEEIITKTYSSYPEADVIIFKITNKVKKLGNKARRLKKLDLLRVCSVQISFRLSSVKGVVSFDPKLGAGSGNGTSEENKFLLDCYKKKLKIQYVPVEIASLLDAESTWYRGHNEEFFFNRGKTTRYIMGVFLATLYALYYLPVKYHEYKGQISVWKAAKCMRKGLFTKNIDARYK